MSLSPGLQDQTSGPKHSANRFIWGIREPQCLRASEVNQNSLRLLLECGHGRGQALAASPENWWWWWWEEEAVGRGSLPLTEAEDTSQVVNKRRINDMGTYWRSKESGDYETQSFGGAANLLAN